MGRKPFAPDPNWSILEFIEHLFQRYRGTGIQGTGVRLSYMRMWFGMLGRTRAMQELGKLEAHLGSSSDALIANHLRMAPSSYRKLVDFVHRLPNRDGTPSQTRPIAAFISYKWESPEHQSWVAKLARDLRFRGIDAKLDQWEVRLGGSFTEYMQHNIGTVDVVLFVITPASVAAAESIEPGRGGALKFEVQMMNARRMAEGTPIIGIYRNGDRPPHYLRDHRYVDFRSDEEYATSLGILVDDLLGRAGPPPLRTVQPPRPTEEDSQAQALGPEQMRTNHDNDSETAYETWFRLVASLLDPDAEVERVANAAVRLSRYFPSVSEEQREFVRYTMRSMSEAQMAGLLQAVELLESEDAPESGELVCDLMSISPEVLSRWRKFLASANLPDELRHISEKVLGYIKDC